MTVEIKRANRITKIVIPEHGEEIGYDKDGNEYIFITNFTNEKLGIYDLAITTLDESDRYAISEKAYDHEFEDLENHCGFYVRGYIELNNFWTHLSKIEQLSREKEYERSD